MKPELENADTPEVDFGILTAPVNGKGTWEALKKLRAALRDARVDATAQVIFVDALDGEGRAVSLHDPHVAALVLGYRLRPAGTRRAS
jgi:hypothetical protein